MTTIYVTRYALTDGPFKVEAEVREDGKSATWEYANGHRWFMYGKDFWLTPEDALADCERRLQAKLKSIEKQKTRLREMQFIIKGFSYDR